MRSSAPRPSTTSAIAAARSKWWKHLTHDDHIGRLRDRVVSELGFEPPVSGLAGGFKEFYAAPFAEHHVRVIPWSVSVPLHTYLQYERSRKSIHDLLGARAPAYYDGIEKALRDALGKGDPMVVLSYMHFVYLAKAPG